MNKASIELASSDPNLLQNKQKLIEQARLKVNAEYTFKKGKSRSKLSQTDVSGPKRQKTSESLWIKHIGQLEEDIQDLKDQIQFKEKWRYQAEVTKNYKSCDHLTEEMSALKKKKRVCEE